MVVIKVPIVGWVQNDDLSKMPFLVATCEYQTVQTGTMPFLVATCEN